MHLSRLNQLLLRLIEHSRVTLTKMMMKNLLLLTSKLRRTLKQLKMPQLMQRNSSANIRLITHLLRRNLTVKLLRKPKR
jgi:predicted FMN-binding regulatory protein PaiB